MRRSRTLILLLMLVSLLVPLLPVRAQSTGISDLSYPSGTAADSLDPVTVTATVTYKDAGPGYALVVGILDMDRPSPDFVPGIAMSSPDICVNQPVLSALCVSRPASSSGAELLEFRIGGILGGNFGVESWNLNMTAVLYDANNTLVESSVSSVPFRIGVSPMTLTVIVPSRAVVLLDGVRQQEGPIKVSIGAGTYNITVPSIVEVDEGTRLRFDRWRDGPTQPNRTVTVNLSQSFEAIYVTQYRLAVVGQTASTMGEGWYDTGYVATFSTAETEQMGGLLGVLGGRLTFEGWYEDDKLVSDSPIDNIIMNGPHTLTLASQTDYTMPMIIVGLLIAVGFALAYVAMRRRSATLMAEERPRTFGPAESQGTATQSRKAKHRQPRPKRRRSR